MTDFYESDYIERETDYDLSDAALDSRNDVIDSLIDTNERFSRLHDVLERMNKQKVYNRFKMLYDAIETEYEQTITDECNELADKASYDKDPYAYLGLSRRMFE